MFLKTNLYRILFLTLLTGCILFMYTFKIRTESFKNDRSFFRTLDTNSTNLFINHESFKGVTPHEKYLTIQLLLAFDKFLTNHNIPYFIWGGSLLGSYRHHGMIPWDDDIDIYMDVHSRPLLRILMKKRQPQVKHHKDAFLLLNDKFVRWKIFWNVTGAVKARDFMWPYIDISFYNITTNRKTKEIGIADLDPGYRIFYPMTDLFPLVKRPFESYLFPAPKCSNNIFVRRSINMTKCCTNTFDHKLEKGINKNKCIGCVNLMEKFAFVQREAFNTTHTTEVLQGPDGQEGKSWIVNKDC